MTKKQEFIKIYLQNHSIIKTCKAIGISEPTAYRMLKNGLREEINRINDELYQSALQDLKIKAHVMNDELIKIVTDKQTPPAVKVNAIKAFYDVVKVNDIADKLEKLELQLNQEVLEK